MLKSKISNINNQIEEMKKSIIKEINSFEQNPKITPLNKNCFTINFKDLIGGTNLCPFYYNHKLQYEYIAEVIQNSKIESILNVLQEIIKTGCHKKAERDIKRFSSVVIDKIKNLI